MNPLVGVTTWRRRLDTFYGPDTLMTLSTSYTDSMVAAGLTPVLIPAALEDADAYRFIDVVDGLLVSGGDDVHPETYGTEPTVSRGIDTEVDRFEIALVEAARAAGKPVLAICRGLQILNVALGGTLLQEVTSKGGAHELITEETDPDEMYTWRHVVRFEPDSIIGGLYGADEAKVNTLHHQGIDRLASDLIVEGRSDDGLIEAARYKGDWWALGVQWHPEKMGVDHRHLLAAFREEMLGPSDGGGDRS
jgi:putative glutamine amidotransferase